jgi:hypothetical protein
LVTSSYSLGWTLVNSPVIHLNPEDRQEVWLQRPEGQIISAMFSVNLFIEKITLLFF